MNNMKVKSNPINDLKHMVYKKTSMPVSNSQLIIFVNEYNNNNGRNIYAACKDLCKLNNFIKFTDFMIERTDIPLFKS